jgi:alpha-amylase
MFQAEAGIGSTVTVITTTDASSLIFSIDSPPLPGRDMPRSNHSINNDKKVLFPGSPGLGSSGFRSPVREAFEDDVITDGDGRVTISVPNMSYAVFGPSGITGGFSPASKRTTQEFQLDDDLGDSRASGLGYGGKITSEDFRKAGSIWVAGDTPARVSVFTEGERHIEIRVHKPDKTGAKSATSGNETATGTASNIKPLTLEFMADREGYHQLSARLTEAGEAPTRGYIKVEYEAPSRSAKF